MQYFPIFVDTKQLNVLVVGGGEVATRKIELLLKSSAKITVVSPDISNDILRFVNNKKVSYLAQSYEESLLDGQQLVFVATANSALNAMISHQAKAKNILANVVDSPALCHFITPSIIDRSPMVFAISSEGRAPVLVRYWRARLESLIPNTLGQIAEFSGRKREQVKQQFSQGGVRRRFWERFFSSSESDDVTSLSPLFERLISSDEQLFAKQGELYLIQVSDNEELLSLAALRHMQQSDIALTDGEIAYGVVELIRRDANISELNQANSLEQIKTLLNDNQRVCVLTKQPLSQWQDTVLALQSTYLIRQFNSALSIT